MTTWDLRRLSVDEMDQAAIVHRIAFNARLSWLADLHTPAEDRWFFRERVFTDCTVWGATDSTLVGFIAFREAWIDHLYILPPWQGKGIGQALLRIAKETWPRLQLWTFQRNAAARRFYERQGFVMIEKTDGTRNEEREPDVLYRWNAA